jgi:hypothetical protein
MTIRRIAIFAMFATTLFSTVSGAQVAPVNDNHGKAWRQLTDTVALSWNQVAQVCPRDGISPCSGVAGGRDLTGWVWATDSEVIELFSYYTPDILTSTTVEGFQYFFPGTAFLSAFRPTFSVFLTYQTAQRAAGWTASTDYAGLPIVGSVSVGTTSVSVGGSFSVVAVNDPDQIDSSLGVFLWRPTGLGTNAIIANDDLGQVPSPAGGTAVANVLANDWLAGAPATTATVTLSQESSTSAGVTLNPDDGSVQVAPGTTATTHSLVYKICETANPDNCATATVKVIVPAYVIKAVNDQGSISPSTGGAAVANVLANDTLGGAVATTANVTLSQVSSTNEGVTLDVAGGSVNVARGTALGVHALVYQICETANPSNCAQATVTVTVIANVVVAVDDYARASSRIAGTAIASVLANDWLGSMRATTANVSLSLVSLSPPNNDIKLDLADGSVDVLRRTQSGTYALVYQICEIASPDNCAQGTATLNLSGK